MAYDYDLETGGGFKNDPSPPPAQDGDLSALRSLYEQFFQQHPGLEKWGSVDDAIRGYQAARSQGLDDNSARQQVTSGLTSWYADNASRVAPAPAATNTGGGGGGTGGGGGGGGLPSPFTSPFTAPAPVNLGGPAGIPYIPQTPQFNPPSYNKPPAFEYQPFTAPTPDEIRSDPGYEFPLSQGLGAISNNAAARGLWASGGTGKAFQDYAQNYANQFSSDIYNRKLGTYMTNFNNALNSYATNAQTQYNTPYQNAYQSAKDQFAPQLTAYTTQAAAGQRQNELNYSNSYQKWLDDFSQRYQTGRFLFDANKA